MGTTINDKVIAEQLTNNLDRIRKRNLDSLEKLSSGQVFTKEDPRPSERALAERLELRLRALSASKKNINDAVSLLQTAEAGLSEINNMITRMKELNATAASTTIDDKDRRYLFIEYEALFDEINRIAVTTNFNGIPLLNGQAENAPKSLVFRVDDPFIPDKGSREDDLNMINFEGIQSIVATTEGLKLASAKEILEDAEDEGGVVPIESAQELMVPEDEDLFNTSYDQALNILSTHRAVLGSMQERLNRAMDFNAVYAENIAAAKSKIADTDYAKEVTKMAQNNILIQATTGLIAQTNLNTAMTLNLIGSALKIL
ncbi:MAG: flagellin [Oligoflexales bacterium]|nr:flagellin [Oligoflexales bacterium]